MSSFTLPKPHTRQMQSTPSFEPYLILFSTLIIVSLVLQSAHSDPQVPCLFVFGDSLSDYGNNNDLPTFAKGNYQPYGVDFPDKQAPGRFTNGQNVVDVISGHLELEESVPSFTSTATMDEHDLLKGVNYASGSAGIRQETGQHLGVRIPLDEQLVNHKSVISRISGLTRSDPSHLSKCLYMINAGSNDYLNNYYVPERYTTSQEYTPQEFAQVLVQHYSQQLQGLYEMGARKVVVFALGELGVTPQAISRLGPLDANQVTVSSTLFNKELRKLLDDLNSKLNYVNITCINMDVIYPTSAIGFVHLTDTCCEVRFDGQCKDDSAPCENRDNYVFFDNFHPTEAMNSRLGGRSYKAASPFDAHPFDIRTLVLN